MLAIVSVWVKFHIAIPFLKYLFSKSVLFEVWTHKSMCDKTGKYADK